MNPKKLGDGLWRVSPKDILLGFHVPFQEDGWNETTGAVPNELCTWTELQVVKVVWPRKISYMTAPGNHYDSVYIYIIYILSYVYIYIYLHICEHGADAIPNV